MRHALELMTLLSLVSGCTAVSKCKPGTILLHVEENGSAAMAAELSVELAIGTVSQSHTVSHVSGASSDDIEMDFSDAYPTAGTVATIKVTALDARGAVIGSPSAITGMISAGCTAQTLMLGTPPDGGNVNTTGNPDLKGAIGNPGGRDGGAGGVSDLHMNSELGNVISSPDLAMVTSVFVCPAQGNFCGGPDSGGSANLLYECASVGAQPTFSVSCPNGCVQVEVGGGQCSPAGTTPPDLSMTGTFLLPDLSTGSTVVCPATGRFCGSELGDGIGDPNTIYNCPIAGEAPIMATPCVMCISLGKEAMCSTPSTSPDLGTSSGTLTYCPQILTCVQGCNYNQTCAASCVTGAAASSQSLFVSLYMCAAPTCLSPSCSPCDSTCGSFNSSTCNSCLINEFFGPCSTQYQACMSDKGGGGGGG